VKEPKLSISNFKLGERPKGDHPRKGTSEEDVELNPLAEKGCVQKQTQTITCPDPHINFYLYSG